MIERKRRNARGNEDNKTSMHIYGLNFSNTFEERQ
jgi:hypothetical protein